MAEENALLHRWDSLGRADRKAILSRLREDQQREWLELLAAGRASISPSSNIASDWTIFSSGIAALLREMEARPGVSPSGLTPAATALILDNAVAIREQEPLPVGLFEKLRGGVQRWLKALDL